MVFWYTLILPAQKSGRGYIWWLRQNWLVRVGFERYRPFESVFPLTVTQNSPYCIIYFSRKMAFWSIVLYIFSKKKLGYDFLKLVGAKRPGGEISEGRNRRWAKSPWIVSDHWQGPASTVIVPPICRQVGLPAPYLITGHSNSVGSDLAKISHHTEYCECDKI